MMASPVMPVYPPIMYPMAGAIASLPSPVGSAVPLFPCKFMRILESGNFVFVLSIKCFV